MDANIELFYLINNGLSNPYLDFAMPPLSDIGGLTFYAVVLAVLCCASLILTIAITAGAKLLFSQPRPSLVLEHVHVLTSSVDPNSFPSGHTATTLSTMTVLFLNVKKYFSRYNLIRCLCVIYCVLIPFSRIYIGMHYPFDVLVGGVIGMACGVVVCRYLEV